MGSAPESRGTLPPLIPPWPLLKKPEGPVQSPKMLGSLGTVVQPEPVWMGMRSDTQTVQNDSSYKDRHNLAW